MIHTIVHASLAQVTDSGRLNNVADSEALDGLVLGDSTSAVRAAHEVNVATAVLVTSSTVSYPLQQGSHIPSIPPLLRHLGLGDGMEEAVLGQPCPPLCLSSHVNNHVYIVLMRGWRYSSKQCISASVKWRTTRARPRRGHLPTRVP